MAKAFWLNLLLIMMGPRAASGQLSDCHKTSWFSDENGYPYDKLDGYPIMGLWCRGDFCDDLQAKQCRSLTDSSGRSLSLHAPHCAESVTFSDTLILGLGVGEGRCPDGRFLESMLCLGSLCDDVRLQCCQPTSWALDLGHVRYTPWFTDHGGEVCPESHVAIGATCLGNFCDDMQLICAPILLNGTTN